ncbi:MAG: hypothetical protein A2X86_05925 [Bdellovibrionales bacterium GWA2_49_15]|nr:MAG: hypothetical protein A2X86_05925 [Bdellovibrionales bacterium GWA2_49_15]
MNQVLTLKQRPDLYRPTLRLVERSFGSAPEHKIEVDFYPLFQEENWENCFILVDDSDALVAHIGIKVKQMSIGDKIFPVALMGGIAVEQEQRGQGYFRNLFQEVINKFENQVAMFVLWSEKNALYGKFGFYEVGEIFEAKYCGNNNKIHASTTLAQLSSDELGIIKSLYTLVYERNYACFKRDEDDWRAITKITSAQLKLSRDDGGRLTGYAFQNKGMDLHDIIYEWSNIELGMSKVEDSEIKIWSPLPLGKDFKNTRTLFLGLVKIGNISLFQSFFNCIFKGKLNLIVQEQSFRIHEHIKQEYGLQAILGMTFSNSVPDKWPIYISGLDSI